ncbi:zinc finger, CCHC-type containing protein [Tanacetum coccineum]
MKKSEWDLSKVRCFKCQKLGHLKKDCRGTSKTQEQSNLMLEDDEPSLLMTTHETEHEEVLLNEGQIQPGKYATADASIWYLDNGASNHMTGTKSHFRDIDESIIGRVRFGDGSYVEINGRGSILLGSYAKITIPHLKKLDDRSISMIYLGDWDKDGKDTSTQDIFWTSFVVDGVDDENTTPVNTEIMINVDNTYQEQDPITDPNSPITPPTYTYNPHSEEEEEATTSSMENLGNRFDDTPVRGFKNLTEIYENTHEVETENLLLMEEEPRTYKEASTDKKWIEAMKIELDSINKNNTWTLTTLPPNQKAIGLKWVFKTKRDAKGKIIKYKARLVAKGYVQEKRKDFIYARPEDHHLRALKQVTDTSKETKEHGKYTKKEGGCKLQVTTTVVMESILNKEKELLLQDKFMAATGAACQALWLKRLLSELTGWEEKRITLKVDNISAIALVRNPVFHGRSKHIDIRYHFIRECVENGHINVEQSRRTTKSRYF